MFEFGSIDFRIRHFFEWENMRIEIDRPIHVGHGEADGSDPRDGLPVSRRNEGGDREKADHEPADRQFGSFIRYKASHSVSSVSSVLYPLT
jgi:hypothetical protein